MIVTEREVSPMDVRHLEVIREGVISFMRRCGSEFATRPGRLASRDWRNSESIWADS